MSLVPTVRPSHLAGDVRRVVRVFDTRGITERPSSGQSPPPATSPAPSADPSSGTADELPDCPVPRLAAGQRLYEVRFRGRPAGLVVGAPQQGSVDVTVYACSDGGVRLSRTVPAP
jgi:hypothetical protein